ncbi:MAG: hypothetical protein E7606_02165 [Ruminococcaceae bacterium]|nr:hypothetical protein [Oscillospiraceae bacterium]
MTANKTSEKVKKNMLRCLGDRIDSFKRKPYSYLALSFLLPIAVMYLIYLVKGVHPFGDESVLVLDLNGQYVYFYEALRNAILGDKSLLYSFSRSLGGEFLGIYAYYVASPFSYIVCLFPQSRILEALLCVFLLKTGISGLTFGYYLHKTTRHPNKYAIWTFSVLYALSSYAIVHQHNSMWIDALMWLPLLSLLIEQMIKHKKYKLYVPLLALTLASNFYIGYMVCIYVVLYFFYYYLAHMGEEGFNPLGEKQHFLRSLGRIAGSSLLAVGIAAVILLAAVYSLSFGKNTFSNPNWDFFLRFDLADLFVKLLPGSYDTVRPEGLPFIYCGVLSLLMLPFYYLCKKITLREKLVSSLFVAIFLLSFTINPVDLVWHGFAKPNWLNYRYSFMLCFFLLTLAYKGLRELRTHSTKVLLAVGAALSLLIMVLQKFEYENFVLDGKYGFEEGRIDPLRTVWFSLAMILFLCAALYLLMRARSTKARRNMATVLLMLVCFEAFGNGIIHMTSLDYDVVYSTYSSYNDYIAKVRPLVNEIQASDTSFYRMEKTTYRKTNDNMALGMRGISNSTSTLNKETITFLYEMGYSSKSHLSRYLGGNPLSDSLLGLKYILCEKNIKETKANYNESMALEDAQKLLNEFYKENAHFTAYYNPYALSLAYAVDDALANFQFKKTTDEGDTIVVYASPFDRLNALITAMVGAEETIQVFVPIEVSSTYTNGQKRTIAGHTHYKDDGEGDASTYALFNIVMPKDALLYFYAPSVYPREVKLSVNDEAYEEFMASDSDRIKALGMRSAGSNVAVKMTLTGENLYIKNDENILYYFDTDAFANAMETLAKEQYQIEAFSETHFLGSLTTSKQKTMILTTIPYDEGWQIKVDGKRVPVAKSLDALVSFEIEGLGEHTVEMTYSPRIVKIGAYISLSSLVVYGGILTVDLLLCKRQKKKASKIR